MRQKGAKRRLPAIARAVAWMVAVLALGSLDSRAQQKVDGILRIYVDQLRSASEKANGYGGTLDLRLQQPVSPVVSYLFSVRVAYDQRGVIFTVPPLTTYDGQVEPRFELRFNPKWFTSSIGGRWLRGRTRTTGSSWLDREEDNYYFRLDSALQNGFVGALEYDLRRIQFDAGAASTNDRLLVQAGYRRDTWSVVAGRRRSTDDLGASGRSRVANESLLFASLNRPLGTQVVLGGSYNFNDTKTTDYVPGTSAVPIQRTVRQGLSALNPFPATGALSADGALIDGNRTTSSRANIGGALAGGQVGWNVGVETAFADPVDLIDVWLSTPISAVSAGFYNWAAYSSGDNLSWTLIAGGVGKTYDPFEGRFRLSVPSVAARYLKIVSTSVDPSQAALFINEIALFGLEIREGAFALRNRTQNASALLTWTPRSEVVTTASLSGTRIASSGDLQPETTLNELVGGVTVAFTPSAALLGSGSALFGHRTRTLSPTEDDATFGLTLTALPVRDLDLTVTASRRRAIRDEEVSTLTSGAFRVTTLLYRDLSAFAEYGRGEETNFSAVPISRETLRAGLNLRPRSEVEFNTDLTGEIRTYILAGANLLERYTIWTNRLTLRPTNLFYVSLQGDYYRQPLRTGWSRAFQVNWSPFPGGNLQLSLDYREDSPLQSQFRRVESATLHWILNRNVFVDFNGTRVTSGAPSALAPRLERTIYSAFLQARI